MYISFVLATCFGLFLGHHQANVCIIQLYKSSLLLSMFICYIVYTLHTLYCLYSTHELFFHRVRWLGGPCTCAYVVFASYWGCIPLAFRCEHVLLPVWVWLFSTCWLLLDVLKCCFLCLVVLRCWYSLSLVTDCIWIFLLTVPQNTRAGVSLRRYCRLSKVIC
jgi:hypothetical protein